MNKKKCEGVHRSPKGDRLLTALVTDPGSSEVVETIARMRLEVPSYEGLTDDEVAERLIKLIAAIPRFCPDCSEVQSD
jgi:hypothetical protein